MKSISRLRPAVILLGRVFASALLAVFLGAPQRTFARVPQSSDALPAQQQTQDPAKKDPASTAPAAPASKTNPPKPHRVFTNDDLSSGSGIPVPPGARRRLKQLNRCDRTCFNEVKKQAISFGYITVFPRSTREEMDDRLANYIEDLHNDPQWQRLLLEMVSSHIESCSARQRDAAQPDDTPPRTPTRAEILEEEKPNRQPRPVPANTFNTTSSAVLAYRFKINPDPLKASLMVHQYMDEIHRDCPAVQSTMDSSADDDP